MAVKYKSKNSNSFTKVVPSILSGSSAPSNALGEDGDIYLQTGSGIDESTLLKQDGSVKYNKIIGKSYGNETTVYNGNTFIDSETTKPNTGSDGSLSMGYDSKATGKGSLAQGRGVEASGSYSHAEGDNTKAYGNTSHAEGDSTIALIDGAHAEGFHTEANGMNSHAEGYHTIANEDCQHVCGRYNDNQQNTLVEIGNGSSSAYRSNIVEVYRDRVNVNGDLYQNGTIVNLSGGSSSGSGGIQDIVELTTRVKDVNFGNNNYYYSNITINTPSGNYAGYEVVGVTGVRTSKPRYIDVRSFQFLSGTCEVTIVFDNSTGDNITPSTLGNFDIYIIALAIKR